MAEPVQPSTESPRDAASRTGSESPTETADRADADGLSQAAMPAARIRVTDAAHDALGRMLDESELGDEGGIRLSAFMGAGCSAPLRYDMALEPAPDADDVVLEREGVRIFMDPESAWVLDGLLVDYVTSSPMGEGFAFRHPNGPAGRSC